MAFDGKSMVPFVPSQVQPEYSPSKRIKLSEDDSARREMVEPTQQSADCTPPQMLSIDQKRSDSSAKGCSLRRAFKRFAKELARSDLSARVEACNAKRKPCEFDSTTFRF